jgi:hypothetical protein
MTRDGEEDATAHQARTPPLRLTSVKADASAFLLVIFIFALGQRHTTSGLGNSPSSLSERHSLYPQ